jgi:uncharacterized protein affecting Mg2+/Co2+ transport
MGDAVTSVQLMARHWVITDSTGRSEEVCARVCSGRWESATHN